MNFLERSLLNFILKLYTRCTTTVNLRVLRKTPCELLLGVYNTDSPVRGSRTQKKENFFFVASIFNNAQVILPICALDLNNDLQSLG